MFTEVKRTGAYWNLLNKAINLKTPESIGPLKRNDGSLALTDEEKAIQLKNVDNGQQSSYRVYYKHKHWTSAFCRACDFRAFSTGKSQRPQNRQARHADPENIPSKILKLASYSTVRFHLL